MEEIWKDIQGYPNYQVSNLGNVKSFHKGKEKILKPDKNEGGYLYVNLYKEGKQKRFRVHRLVATAFLDNPNNYPEVNHKNEIKTDNRVDNLEWCTPKYNANYGTRNERHAKTIKGENHPRAKAVICLSTNAVFATATEGANFYNINQSHIYKCCNYKRNYCGKLEDGTKLVWRYLTIIPL